MTTILYAEEGYVATITLNRPERLNAFNQCQRREFIDVMDRAAQSEAVRAIVICGAGRGFSAGGDLGELATRNTLPTREEVRAELEEEYLPGIVAIQRSAKPVIAAVHGFAAGIGVAYALACDLLIIGERAFLQVPFADIGLVPDGGACWQLVRRLGYMRAFELAIEGERIVAHRCLEWGLANRAVADDDVLAEAKAWAARLAAKAQLAIYGTKRAMRLAESASVEDVMQLEIRMQQVCAVSADYGEGLRAFFGKRTPSFAGK